jgi:hypothetical protein
MATQIASARWRLAAAAVGLLLLLACGGAPDRRGGETNGSGGAAPSARVAAAADAATAATIESCAGFGPNEAAEFLGVPAPTIVEKSERLAPTLRLCTFAARDDEAKAVSFSLSLEKSAEDAARTYAQMKDDIPVAESAQESAGVESGDSALIEISGLGDEALWTNVNGALTVRKDNLTIQVMMPRERRRQIAVADKILRGMR